ncbi:hypothetical protein AB0M02_12285 [Actinoplanes sp. NPDC051861]|uniref:hypothetical protein n=1 Tax=Actinoplanes sp. NPDC051861 TaxID=3155170 RepID=UPI00342F6813
MPRLIVLICLVMLAGCGSLGEREDAAAETATAFLRAVSGQDGAAACGVLAPETMAEVEQGAGQSCAVAILSENLPAPSAVQDIQVYGQRALVRLEDESVFLAVFPGG